MTVQEREAVEELVAEGREHIKEKRYRKAEEVLESAVAADGFNFNAWNNLGASRYHLKEYGVAKAAYEKAISLDPESTNAWYNLALCHIELKEYHLASLAARRALQLQPDNWKACNTLGLALMYFRDYNAALECFERAAGLEPAAGTPWYNVACLYSLTGQTDKAFEPLARSIKLQPERYRKLSRVDEDLASLRGDERFLRIVEG